jgi:sensor histidine kinase YesM
MNQLFDYLLKFYKTHRELTHVLFWVVTLLWGSLYVYFTGDSGNLTFLELLFKDFLDNSAKIPTAYLVVYFLFPRVFNEKKYFSSIIIFILGSYGFYIIFSIVRIKCYPLLGIYFSEKDPIVSLLTTPKLFYKFFFFKNIGAGAAMLLIKFILNQSEIKNQALSLAKQKSEIELKLLKTQLNPHFLFNTLNNIYSLSLQNSPKTSESIARLSEILDYILYRCEGKTVPISGEIQLIENYIVLEKLRYDERLQVNFRKSIEKNAEIAPLILLSLVENAFKHGASEDVGNPKIDIDLKTNEKEIRFEVVNSVMSPMKGQTVASKGIGLENLRQQLGLIYGKNATLYINQLENEFSVILQITLNNNI